MIFVAIAALLFVILPLAAYLIRASASAEKFFETVERTTTVFRIPQRTYGRTPLILEPRKASQHAEASSRVTVMTFSAFR
jgi:hypothetical protein